MSIAPHRKPAHRCLGTVSSQLAALVAIGLGIGFLIVVSLQIAQYRSLLHDMQLQHSVHTTKLMAEQLYDAVRWRKPAVIDDIYESLLSQPELGATATLTLDRFGQTLTSYHKPGSAPVDLQALAPVAHALPSDESLATTTADDLFVVVAPVFSVERDDRAGTIAVAWDLSRLNAMARTTAIRQGAAALASLCIFAVAALVYVNRRLSRPLAEVTEATNRVANGDKSFEIPWTKRKDEIGDMARSLETFRENVALIDRLTAEQQQQTLRLSESLEKERQYNALQREFVTMVSHEFRTPVAIIDGAAQRIDRRAGKDTPDQLRQRTVKIRGAVARMIELIDSTLSVSRMEAGTIELELKPTDLATLLKEVCQRQQDIATDHRISLAVADLPATLLVDAHRMDQVFTNLLSNAVKYAPEAPQIDVKAGTIGDNVVISVRDFGLGIPKGEMPKLFEKFFRASTSTGIPGTGIGLHLVKHLVEMHHGNISVDSTEGQGSTFAVSLPLAGAPAPERPAPGTPAPGTPAPGTPAPGTPAPGTPAPGTPASDVASPALLAG